MKQKIDFDTEVIKKYMTCQENRALAEYIKKIFPLVKDGTGLPTQYEFSENVINTLLGLLETIQSNNINEQDVILLTEIYRALRIYVINSDVQNYLITDMKFLENTKKILHYMLERLEFDTLLKIMLQFFINFIISNEKNTCKLFDLYQNEIVLFLKQKRCSYEISALLYYVSLYKSLESLDLDFYLSVLNLELDKNTEFLYFLIETFTSYNSYWQCHYPQIDIKCRITTLELIREQQIQNKKINLSEHAITTLTNQFINSNDIIFQTATTTTNHSDLAPYEICLLLEIISSLCTEEFLQILQKNTNLLINAGILLINIHRLGKEGENFFSPIEKLAQVRQPNELITKHPAFGFKVGLIKIISNLCWKNPKMQNLAREAELIPILLDCCNIDARNPFIMQWAIFAIRNLCEKNKENQEFIAKMHNQGTVSSSTLEEMGLTLDSDGENKIKIVPLDSLRSSPR